MKQLLKRIFYTQKRYQRDYLWADKLRDMGFPQMLSNYKGYHVCDHEKIKHATFTPKQHLCGVQEVYVPTFSEIKEFLKTL